jgi:N-acetylneuraminate synthase
MAEGVFGDMKIKKPFLIAEIGINHNGDIDLAKKLIKLSSECNFDAVKFQKRDIYTVYSKDQLATPRESPWGDTTEDQKKGLEFSQKEYEIIDQYCKELNIKWFASAWDINSLDFLNQFNLEFNKIASAMIVDKKFLREVAKQKKYTFISTGMSSKNNIDDAVKIFQENSCDFELMHCISTYPMKAGDANLETINDLKKIYKCNVGYSGHENGAIVSLAALSYGISSLERHITLDRAMYGSDQSASLEEKGMKFLTEAIDKFIVSLGESKVGNIHKDEIAIAKKLRAHIDQNAN